MSRFSFTGNARFNGQDNKFPAYRSGETKTGNKYHSITFFVNSDDNNSGTVELFGMKSSTIKTTTDEGEVEIDWSDRKDSKVVESVVGYRKNVIQLEEGNENRKSFIASYDAVQYLWDNIDELKGKLITVTGRVTKNEYNGKISDRFQLQNVYVAKEDKKPGLTLKEEIFFNKDSFDFDDFKESKRIYINAYTQEYMDKEHPSVYVPKTFVIDASKVDFDDEKMVKLFNGRFMPLNLKYEKGKLTVNLKSNKYYKMMVDVNYRNGASEEEFTEDMLTEMQKSQLDLGLKTLDDFRPAGRTFGNRVVEYRLVNCDIRGDYADGVVTLDDSAEDFEDLIYQVVDDEGGDGDVELGMNPPEEEEEKPKKKGAPKKEEKKPEPKPEEEEDDPLDDLFS